MHSHVLPFLTMLGICFGFSSCEHKLAQGKDDEQKIHSYPPGGKPNKITLIASSKTVVFEVTVLNHEKPKTFITPGTTFPGKKPSESRLIIRGPTLEADVTPSNYVAEELLLSKGQHIKALNDGLTASTKGGYSLEEVSLEFQNDTLYDQLYAGRLKSYGVAFIGWYTSASLTHTSIEFDPSVEIILR